MTGGPLMENMWFVAAAWMGLALVASVISIRLGISVALVEMFVGVIGGNFLGFHTTPWIDFLATFGSGLLTFLAGAEILGFTNLSSMLCSDLGCWVYYEDTL